MDRRYAQIAEEAKGFMPPDEGAALYAAGLAAAARGPLLEVGSFCGKSSVYLGAAARERGTVLFSLDHHRGSEEHQPGEEYFDAEIFDERSGRVDTLPCFLATIARAQLEEVIVPLVGDSAAVAAAWSLPLGLAFIDGGHSEEAARADLAGWADHIVPEGLVAIHDVFEDPSMGGRPPYNIFRSALGSGAFVECSAQGSLRVLERVGDRI